MDGMSALRTENPALAFLLERRSCTNVRAPGPSDEELQLILRAALRVPDFQHLRPYRFLAARGRARWCRASPSNCAPPAAC